MGVRMVGQWRSPGVQHGREPDARAEMLGVGCNGDQGLGRDLEQQVIDDRLVAMSAIGLPDLNILGVTFSAGCHPRIGAMSNKRPRPLPARSRFQSAGLRARTAV